MTETEIEYIAPETSTPAHRLKQHGHGLCLVGFFFLGFGLWLAWPPSVDSVDWSASDLEYLWHALVGFVTLAAIPCMVGSWMGLTGLGLLQRRSWARQALGGFSIALHLSASGGWGYWMGYTNGHADSMPIGCFTHLFFGVLFGGLVVSACGLLKYAWSAEVRALCGGSDEPVLPWHWLWLWTAALLSFGGALVWGSLL